MSADFSAVSESELRCPNGPGKLLAKVFSAGEQPQYVHPANWIELACLDCKRARVRRGQDCQRVLHRFNIIGELIETLIVE